MNCNRRVRKGLINFILIIKINLTMVLNDLRLFLSNSWVNFWTNEFNTINDNIHDITSPAYTYLWLVIFIKIFRWYEKNGRSN